MEMLVIVALGLALPLLAAGDDTLRDATPYAVNDYFCESADYAVAFAAAVAANADEEFAKDIVGKTAKREVCGRYIGMAAVDQEKTVIAGGIVYRLTELRFREDQKIAWRAERIFAVRGDSPMRHL
jgi:hypothetical protein